MLAFEQVYITVKIMSYDKKNFLDEKKNFFNEKKNPLDEKKIFELSPIEKNYNFKWNKLIFED